MDYSTAILGKSTATYLQARAVSPLLKIGKDTFSRTDLSGSACFNFIAAATLSRAIEAIGGVKDTAHLFARVPPTALAQPNIGPIALAVLGAAFQVKGIGGNSPLKAWVHQHATNIEDPLVTFHTIKARELRELRAAKKAQKAAARKKS